MYRTLAAMLERLRQLRDLDGFRHVYVVTDPLIASIPIRDWLSRMGAGKFWVLRDPQVVDLSLPCPVVFQLDKSDDDLLQETLQIAGVSSEHGDRITPNPAVCAWLFSRAIADDVSRHLLAATLQRNDTCRPVLLRFMDPRVLPHLGRILKPAQQHQLLGPVDHWFALDRQGSLVDLQTQAPPPYSDPALALNAEQWARIGRIEAFNRALVAYAAATGEALPTDRDDDLSASLDRAAAHGISRADDLVTFALYSLLIHPRFDRHRLVATTLSAFSPDQQKLADALQALPEPLWEAMRSASSAPHT